MLIFDRNLTLRHAVQFVLLMLSLSCMGEGPGLYSQSDSIDDSQKEYGNKERSDEMSSSAIVYWDGRSIQTVTAQENSPIDGTFIRFPIESVEKTTRVWLTPGATLAGAETKEVLELSAEMKLKSIAAPIIVSSDEPIDTVKPYTMSIPFAKGYEWTEGDEKPNLAIIYKRWQQDESGNLSHGILPRSAFTISDSAVQMETVYFGEFHVVELESPLEKEIRKPAAYEVVKYVEMATSIGFGELPSEGIVKWALDPALEVSAYRSDGELATKYRGLVTLSLINTEQSGLLGGVITVRAEAGVAKFPGVSVEAIMTGVVIQAAEWDGMTVQTTPFTVYEQPAAQIIFKNFPSDTVAGENLGVIEVYAINEDLIRDTRFVQPIEIILLDEEGNEVEMKGTLSQNAVGGIVRFNDNFSEIAGKNYTLKGRSAGLLDGESTPFSILPAPAERIEFEVEPPRVKYEDIFTVKVAAKDKFSNTNDLFSGSVTLAFDVNPVSATLGGTLTISFADGVASFTNLEIDKPAQNFKLIATNSDLGTVKSEDFVIDPYPATKLVYSQQPGNIVAGNNFSPEVSVEAQDANNFVDFNYTSPILIQFGTNPSGGGLIGTASITPVNGKSTFNDLSVHKAATGYTFQASSTSLAGATSSSFDVSFAALDTIKFVSSVASAVSDVAIADIDLRAEDQFGNLITNHTANVSLTFETDASLATDAFITGAGPFPMTAGIYTFSGVSVDKAGNGFKFLATSNSKTGISSAFNIAVGPAANFVFVEQPVDTRMGDVMTTATVHAQDAGGNTVTTYTNPISVALIGTAGTLGGTVSGITPTAGVYSLDDLWVDDISTGTVTLRATGALALGNSAAFNITKPFCGGNGSGGSPYQICSVWGLQYIATESLSDSYVLANDIDATITSSWNSSDGFVPIGQGTAFSGTLDGIGYRVLGLSVARNAEDYVGLFGKINAGTVKNISLVGSNIVGKDYVGGIAGLLTSATIDSVIVDGLVEAQGATGIVGGVVGKAESSATIKHAISYGKVRTGGDVAGGIAGLATGASTIIEAVASFAKVRSVAPDSADKMGGVVGELTAAAELRVAAAFGSVRGDNIVGGLVGLSDAGAVVEASFANAGVHAATITAGGAVGENRYTGVSSTVSGVSSAGFVSGGSGEVGGLVGANTGTINRSHATGLSSTGSGSEGGLVGDNSTANGLIQFSYYHNHSGNAAACFGADSNTQACSGLSSKPILSTAEVGFAPWVKASKIGNSDESTRVFAGYCELDGATVKLTLTDGTNNLSQASTCSAGRWSMVQDSSTLDDGTDNVTASIQIQMNACTLDTDCTIESVAMSKDSATCDSFSTNGAGFASGDGSSGSPYLICSLSHLNKVRDNLSSSFKLGDNIDVASAAWAGVIGASGSPFAGSFDGQSFALSRLFIANGDATNVGLFANVSASTNEIKNIRLHQLAIVGASLSGGLAGELTSGAVSNIFTDGAVLGKGAGVGGVFGRVNSAQRGKSLDQLNVNGAVLASTGVNRVGGVIGQNYANLDSSEMHGFVGGGSNIGGLVGELLGGSISKSRAVGSSAALGTHVGGLVGLVQFSGSAASVSDSYAHVNIYGKSSHAAGAIGQITGSSGNISQVQRIYASGNVAAIGSYATGLVGVLHDYTNLEDSFAAAEFIYGDNSTDAGAIGQQSATSASIADCFWYDETTNSGAGIASAQGGSCTAKTDATFFHASANAPLSDWDFATPIWIIPTPADYPLLNAFE